MYRKEVGSPLNFRGLIYSPINEQGVVYLFSLIAKDLNIRVESIQQGYPDCTAIRYIGGGKWERVNIEFEYKSSQFDHDPSKCDIVVCWEDDLSEDKRERLKGLEIIELKSTINTPEVPDEKLTEPEEAKGRKTEYDLGYHFERSSATGRVQELYRELDKGIRDIHGSVWVKYAKTSITYYSPEKVFVFVGLRKSTISLTIYTDQNKLKDVKNIKDHENWGRIIIESKNKLPVAIEAIKKSYELISEAIRNNRNTGWYALTPKDKGLTSTEWR